MKKINNPFDFFDAIYCINLDERHDRWFAVQGEFHKMGITDRVKRFSAIRTPKNGCIGCMLSHRFIIQEAKKLGFRNILIFEDDIRIMQPEKMLDEMGILIKKEFDMLYLGGIFNSPDSKIKKDKDHISITRGVYGAFAIGISQNIYDILLHLMPEDGNLGKRKINNFDEFLANAIQRYYTCIMPLKNYIDQNIGYSDLTRKHKGLFYRYINNLCFFLAQYDHLYLIKFILIYSFYRLFDFINKIF